MRIIVPYKNKKSITYKDRKGECIYTDENEKEYECIIVEISTNGTYVLETIEDYEK